MTMFIEVNNKDRERETRHLKVTEDLCVLCLRQFFFEIIALDVATNIINGWQAGKNMIGICQSSCDFFELSVSSSR